MCKPSRCCNSRSDNAVGIVAIVIIALIIAAAARPIVVAIGHVVVEVIKLAAIGIASGATLAAVIWVAVQVLRARATARAVPRIHLTARQEPARLKARAISGQSCITCGDTGRIMRVTGNGNSFQIRACPQCQPAKLAR